MNINVWNHNCTIIRLLLVSNIFHQFQRVSKITKVRFCLIQTDLALFLGGRGDDLYYREINDAERFSRDKRTLVMSFNDSRQGDCTYSPVIARGLNQEMERNGDLKRRKGEEEEEEEGKKVKRLARN